MFIIDVIHEQEALDLLLLEEAMQLYRVYFFDQHMNIVDEQDRLTTNGKPHRWADAQVKRNNWYTYAIGKLG